MNKGLAVALIATAGCAASYNYTATTGVTAPAKAMGCNFDVLTTRPERPYDELGVLEPAPAWVRDIGAFRDTVRPHVCSVGGDAVLAEINGRGDDMRGTVIRYRPQ